MDDKYEIKGLNIRVEEGGVIKYYDENLILRIDGEGSTLYFDHGILANNHSAEPSENIPQVVGQWVGGNNVVLDTLPSVEIDKFEYRSVKYFENIFSDKDTAMNKEIQEAVNTCLFRLEQSLKLENLRSCNTIIPKKLKSFVVKRLKDSGFLVSDTSMTCSSVTYPTSCGGSCTQRTLEDEIILTVSF